MEQAWMDMIRIEEVATITTESDGLALLSIKETHLLWQKINFFKNFLAFGFYLKVDGLESREMPLPFGNQTLSRNKDSCFYFPDFS